jgi:hypothetical protein
VGFVITFLDRVGEEVDKAFAEGSANHDW